jgi:hypothetical protein
LNFAKTGGILTLLWDLNAWIRQLTAALRPLGKRDGACVKNG